MPIHVAGVLNDGAALLIATPCWLAVGMALGLQLDSEVLSLDWDAAGTRLATLSADGKARLWSASLMSTEFRVEATLTP